MSFNYTMDLDGGASPWDDVPSQSTSPPNQPKDDDHQNSSLAQSTETTSSPAASTTLTGGSGRRGRGPKKIVRLGPQPTKLQAVDDTLGPLGPLGDGSAPGGADDAAPAGDDVGSPGTHPGAASQSSSLSRLMDSASLQDDGDGDGFYGKPRVPPPVQPPSGEQPQRQNQPSVGVVEAARPTFHITVGDPHKVGDLTSSHTEYQVYTKTTSKAYRNPEFVVSRRFRDFLWLYNQLHQNNPGIIVPPPPEKQALNRFDADFVESRRQALERMLNKIAAHPTLQHDADLKLFLESESFHVDVKHKERKEPLVGESKGLFGIGSGSSGKFIEHDDWFHDRRIYLDALENQLKALEKAIDTVVEQRRSLAAACGDFSASLHSLAAVELSPLLSGPLEGLSEVQLRIRDLYDRQAQQDVLTFGIVIDEYIRLIGSCKMAFQMRQKSYHSWHSAEAELAKRKAAQDKLLRQGRSQQDRINQVQAEVADAEKRAHQARLLFEDMGRIVRVECERFEREKVEDFKSGVETYLEGAVEAQKELIEIWETYLMRLDADDDTATLVDEPAPEGRASGAESTAPTAVDEHERPVSQASEDEERRVTRSAEES
ncbi:uncharacterized protein PV09_06100 [Verruconis gallopava]|uniref:PX domain-containing protein n=1 Tax=Verruconis gallopava TaxID=253628 RepID=A0A0D2A7D7_9PEZI|nr:uncharacterized protein PV09_06100 [Verruconis gallopava]KIW02663.1 hypothetical protein PV09_06100 [Verruconis gallopava]